MRKTPYFIGWCAAVEHMPPDPEDLPKKPPENPYNAEEDFEAYRDWEAGYSDAHNFHANNWP